MILLMILLPDNVCPSVEEVAWYQKTLPTSWVLALVTTDATILCVRVGKGMERKSLMMVL